jgi:hypothetical protein
VYQFIDTKSHILNGLFITIDIAPNIFDTDFCAAKAIASQPIPAQAIKALISYPRFQTRVIIQIIHTNKSTTLFIIGNICLDNLDIHHFFITSFVTVFERDDTRNSKITTINTLNALSIISCILSDVSKK